MLLTLIKAIIFGIIEGITEWLPISSTGHMILLESLVPLDVSPEFTEMFRVVIQLGAVLAVVALYFRRLFPFCPGQTKRERGAVWSLWGKIAVSCIPAAIIGLLFDDRIDALFYNAPTVAATLIFYGIVFIVLERGKSDAKHLAHADTVADFTYKTALLIGVVQLLALIPGTSRSGATIIGAMLLGASRAAAAEYTFFLAIPVMLGAGALKLVKFGFDFAPNEAITLAAAFVTAFVVSVAAIRFLVGYVKRHTFAGFGYYRVALGLLVILWFAAS